MFGAMFNAIVMFSAMSAHAAVTVVDKDQWKVDMGGFIETDTIYDSRRGLTETIGNTPIPQANGAKGRAQFSIRNSRLSFNVLAPVVDDWKTRAYFEFDLLGYDPGTSGTVTQSEAGFSNNPTFRVRHVYMNAEKNGWQFLAGQTWALLGWQPYYFMPTIQVSPVAGMLYSRTSQLRAVKSLDVAEETTLQMAVGIMRPPQRESSLPAVEAGARLAFNSWKGAFTGGATGSHKPQPLSVGISGTVRDFEVPKNTASAGSDTRSYTGSAVAIDTLIPILRSKDGKDTSNNLVLGGEFTTGTGDGDQFNQWTGGMYNPLNTSSTAPEKNLNLDAGIGGFHSDGGFSLVKVQTWNAYAQYHLPAAWRAWLSAGYGELASSNLSGFTSYNVASSTPYSKERVIFINASHDCTDQIRVGLEYANTRTSYTTGGFNPPEDNRFQASAWFMF
jgi:hypothetical protein